MNNIGAQPATVSGEAQRIPAAQKVTIEEGAALLKSQGGSLKAEVTITRAGTGKVEHYTLDMKPEGA